jgi:hypothetical protein
MQFVNNYSEPVTLATGATTLALTLPDGEYRLTLVDSASNATRWEIVGATVAAGSATLTRALEGTTDQGWTSGSVIYCALTAGLLTELLAFKGVATADISSIKQRLDALEVAAETDDGFFAASDGAWNATHDNGDGTTGRWEVPPGTTFTALNSGALENQYNGGLGSLIAFASGGSNYASVSWSGTFVFSITGAVPGSNNGQVGSLEAYYSSSDGAWAGVTINVPGGSPADTILYPRLYLNAQA